MIAFFIGVIIIAFGAREAYHEQEEYKAHPKTWCVNEHCDGEEILPPDPTPTPTPAR